MSLEPSRKHLAAFIDVIFRRATKGVVSICAFRDNGSNEVFRFSSSPVDKRENLLNVVEDDARRAAQAPFPVVFCPPLCTFNNEHSAKETDIAEGLVITAELDQHPKQAREKLIAILGIPTLEVKSGGRWQNGTGIEDKLHLHWRLARPATGPEEHARLKRARSLVSRLVGGDTSCDPINHPVRWPGSWHRKAEPRPCQIIVQNADIEVELDTALEALIDAAAAAGISEVDRRVSDPHGYADGADDWARLFGSVLGGTDIHVSTRDLAAKFVVLGVPDGAAVNIIRGIMECSSAPHDQCYQARYAKIPELVRSARQKFTGAPAIPQSPPSDKPASPSDRVRSALAAVAQAREGDLEALVREGVSAIRGLISRHEIDGAGGERALKALDIVSQRKGLPRDVAQAILAEHTVS